eukprot:5633205-Amphidinium_carterae.1
MKQLQLELQAVQKEAKDLRAQLGSQTLQSSATAALPQSTPAGPALAVRATGHAALQSQPTAPKHIISA